MAICAVLRDGPLRRSEAADLRWEDVTFQASGTRGISPRGPPLEDLLALRPAYLDPQALVFGISDGQVGRRVRSAARAAGLGEDFSGHSGRIGMARRMVAAGASARQCSAKAGGGKATWCRATRGETVGEVLKWLS